MKKIVIMSVTAAVLIVAVISNIYGWRMFGFKYCENPKSICIKHAEIKDGYLYLSNFPLPYSMQPSYDGYVAEIKGDTIYVGIKTRYFFAKTKTSSFDLKIPANNNIRKLVMKGGKGEEEYQLPYDMPTN